MYNFATKSENDMKYKIKKETKPKLSTFGKYKAVAVHEQTIDSRQICKEAAKRLGTGEGDVHGVMLALASVVNSHLRNGDRVRLQDWGMLKLEIESEKIGNIKDREKYNECGESEKMGNRHDFSAKKHIRGVRLHFIPESENGSQPLYAGITFHKDKTSDYEDPK